MLPITKSLHLLSINEQEIGRALGCAIDTEALSVALKEVSLPYTCYKVSHEVRWCSVAAGVSCCNLVVNGKCFTTWGIFIFGHHIAFVLTFYWAVIQLYTGSVTQNDRVKDSLSLSVIKNITYNTTIQYIISSTLLKQNKLCCIHFIVC